VSKGAACGQETKSSGPDDARAPFEKEKNGADVFLRRFGPPPLLLPADGKKSGEKYPSRG
jgi:hypothetical protein